ncbi:MAG: SDR family NAD(P)-dependent oxidoreductase [Methylacidiphilales bacterium]|nr:SDR family NAD(P)-dependent oxidoreductase [Candidatus Methylacidiphilales bacterium]
MSKLIVITGATRGLGLALTRYFASEGHTVIGCGRSQDKIDALNAELAEPHLFQKVDIANDSEVRNWARHVLESYGPPDFLLNNAALMNPTRPLWEIEAVEFDPVIDVNIKGTANVIRHFVPAMAARKRGVVVNFSSGWGRSTSPEVAPYCATKWAIEGLTQALAQELPQGMAAVALNPGIIDTDMLRSCWADGASAYPAPELWIKKAGPYIQKLGSKNNGNSLSVPGATD